MARYQKLDSVSKIVNVGSSLRQKSVDTTMVTLNPLDANTGHLMDEPSALDAELVVTNL
jgi:hypothetical protein